MRRTFVVATAVFGWTCLFAAEEKREPPTPQISTETAEPTDSSSLTIFTYSRAASSRNVAR
jgi:hypothetical protein